MEKKKEKKERQTDRETGAIDQPETDRKSWTELL